MLRIVQALLLAAFVQPHIVIVIIIIILPPPVHSPILHHHPPQLHLHFRATQVLRQVRLQLFIPVLVYPALLHLIGHVLLR